MASGLGVRLSAVQILQRAASKPRRLLADAAIIRHARPSPRARMPQAQETSSGATQRQQLQRFTASLRALPAEKRGRRAALIFTGLPVRGLRPSRGAGLTTRRWTTP